MILIVSHFYETISNWVIDDLELKLKKPFYNDRCFDSHDDSCFDKIYLC